jgi:hypothetical protein
MGPIEKLREMGHLVFKVTQDHYRVDGRFDFWYPRGIWHDLETHERGKKPLEQMHFFVHRRLLERSSDESQDDPQRVDQECGVRSGNKNS